MKLPLSTHSSLGKDKDCEHVFFKYVVSSHIACHDCIYDLFAILGFKLSTFFSLSKIQIVNHEHYKMREKERETYSSTSTILNSNLSINSFKCYLTSVGVTHRSIKLSKTLGNFNWEILPSNGSLFSDNKKISPFFSF